MDKSTWRRSGALKEHADLCVAILGEWPDAMNEMKASVANAVIVADVVGRLEAKDAAVGSGVVDRLTVDAEVVPETPKSRRMSEAEKRRISKRMRRHWAKRRAAGKTGRLNT